MKVLHRPEVVGLLVLVVVGLAWVAASQGMRRGSPDEKSIDVAITRVTATPDGAHRRLRIEFTVRHPRATAMIAGPPHVRLLGAANEPLPEFFAPGGFPPAIPAGVKAASWAEYWLDARQAAGPLTFEVAGRRLPVPAQK